MEYVNYNDLKKPFNEYVAYPILTNREIYYLPEFSAIMYHFFPDDDVVQGFVGPLWKMQAPKFYGSEGAVGRFFKLNDLYKDVVSIYENSNIFADRYTSKLFAKLEEHFNPSFTVCIV